MVEVKEGAAEAVESSVSSGYSLRVIREGRPGFSYSTDPEEAGAVAERAIESSMWSEPDEFQTLPQPAVPAMPEIHDPAIEGIKQEEALEKALLIESAAMKDPRVKRLRKTTAGFAVSETFIYNTNGMGFGYKATSCTAHTMAVAEEGGESQMGWDFKAGRLLREVSFEGVGRTARERAVGMLGARRITARKSPLIISAPVAVEFLGLFASLLSSDAVQKGKSLLKGRLGEKVISDRLSIVDDGLMPGKSGSRPVDDEGVPVMRKYLIKDGALKGFMYNTYTARKDNTKSTGNASRAGFSSTPGIGPTNIYIEAGPVQKDLIGALGEGLFVTEAMGMHMANPISGDFSIGVSGLWVEGGKAVFPVKEAVISGNILGLFSGISSAGEDLEFYGNTGSPSLLTGPVDIGA